MTQEYKRGDQETENMGLPILKGEVYGINRMGRKAD